MDYPLFNIFVTTMWVFLWILWIFLLVAVFLDLFRDRGLGGWAKAGWSVFLILMPFLGVFVYLIARGKGMAERQAREPVTAESGFRDDAGEAAKGPSAADTGDQLVRLVELKDRGELSEEEYQQAKAKLLAA